MRILVIEDDKEVASYIAKGLQENGFAVDTAFDGREGLFLATGETYDAIILDRMLPVISGLSILQTLRDSDITTPVLMLSAMGEVNHRVEGLKAGSDDYMAKPFSITELITRIQVLLKRQSGHAQITEIKAGNLVLNLLSRQVTRDGKTIDLKPREYQLLEYFMRHQDQVVTRTMLFEHVWDYNFDPQTNVIDVHVSRLRKKIDGDFDENLLNTVRGAGYILKAPSSND